jgi:hypothetical protein
VCIIDFLHYLFLLITISYYFQCHYFLNTIIAILLMFLSFTFLLLLLILLVFKSIDAALIYSDLQAILLAIFYVISTYLFLNYRYATILKHG